MKTTALLAMFVAVVVVVLGIGASATAPPDIAGKWLGKTEVPDAGTDQVTMVLKKAGQGYTGTIEDSIGQVAAGTQLKDLKLEDTVLTGSFPIADGAVISMKLTVDGEKMTGEWSHPQGASGAIAFERQKGK